MRIVLTLLAALWLGPAQAADTAPLSPPADSAIPVGPLGDAIRHGAKVLNQTQTYAKPYVGNGLNCTSCHLNGGRTAYASPLAGLWGVFPAYSSRSGRVITLTDRINACFERSMNGKPLPLDSAEMRGLLAYIAWLSQGVPTGASVEGRGFLALGAPARTPDPTQGKTLYTARCAACHGQDGQGIPGAMPALWGPQSFNIGAGMARLDTAAAFIKAKMPLGQDNSLSEQDAYDIAAYFTRQPRPDFKDKRQDWPKGGKPADARY